MLADFRTQKIKWDKADNVINTGLSAHEGDQNGRKLALQITDGGEQEVLTGASVSLAWQTQKGDHYGLEAFTETDGEFGLFELVYPTGMLTNVGVLKASIVLVVDGSRLESREFSITVTRSNVNDAAVESENSFTALTEALVKVDSWNNDFEGFKLGWEDTFSQLEANYAPQLQDVTAQLAQTQQDFDVAVGAITVDSEVVLARNGETTLGERLDKSDSRIKEVEQKTGLIADYPIKGSLENGFYGFIQPSEMGLIESNPEGSQAFNGANLALAIGLSSGTAINQDTAWMKFSRKGDIYLVPVKPLRHSAPWNAIYNQGAVYGDGTNGVNPPNGRAGNRLSVSAANSSFVIDAAIDDGFLKSGAVTAAVGDILVTKGFTNDENNGEFTVTAITDTEITVDGTLVDETGTPSSSVYEKTDAVKQDRDVVIGGNRYRVQLLKGSEQDPLNSFADSDRDMVGPNSEWNNLILPLHERAKLQDWRYSAYAGTTEDWGIGLTDADLITHHEFGTGNYTWCQETNDETPYRRVIRGYDGASGGGHGGSWGTWVGLGWRPVLRLLS